MKIMLFEKKRTKVIAAAALILAFAALAMILVPPDSATTAAQTQKDIPIYCVSTQEKKVAITFDAAWGDEQTEGILELLDRYGVKATFFLVGYWVDAYPERVQMITQRGHEIGCHSSTHPHMAKMSRDQILSEIQGNSAKLESLTDRKITLFRPPYGEWDENLVRVCRDAGYDVIQWNIDSLDWKGTDAQEMVHRVRKKLEPGSILLFHNNSEHILEGLEAVLQELQTQDYTACPVSELIHPAPYTVDHEGRQFPISSQAS